MKKFKTAAILCGGKSRRMGLDKSMIKVGGRFLIQIIGDELNKVFQEVILIADDIDKFAGFGYRVVEDLQKGLGPTGGIYTAVAASSSHYIFVTACDMPFIELDYIRYMMGILESQPFDCVISRNGEWVEPMYSFYSKNMKESFEKGIENGNLKLFEIIKRNKVLYIEEEIVRRYSSDLKIFVNLNYQKDLEALRQTYGKEADVYAQR